ncbi:hypothetical protein NEPAR06_1827 [Nematocida parisii]|uniref:Transcription elongation factor 1 homolog n=1 Tax=Nematocida parisii (strain ERTm3) TaxID=935791 RepID=I3EFT6_NEMP3|nr:uncharacterized protein NEPG_01424 [Nematocida parisii ERTm1]EIJ88083.1 hypothetical protein NEQG_01527 [Nematocida parisii ERTm3]KAI5130044.1 hypothetical protein NEPAR03_1926 [Nematocida parisii]KAI5167074.1 hypothetical protein NEIRO02_1654 [Nematocida sp. AWRm79]KAI5183981.1 hypothetical protein NEIRO03_1448 [Nematocida sp. AWRm78]EIJ93852.1 hypothetical protein NEPG_01424 [Nematocida parisii ERTm1]|eukprot:XP_013059252.1 hypothetical protein NEPG_01424 [Nematocida parisii ERTm1]
MARKKTQRVKRKAPNARAEKRFSCLECNREHTVVCVIESAKNRGTAKCTFCEATHRCQTNRLSQAIDVYADWVDHVEKKSSM